MANLVLERSPILVKSVSLCTRPPRPHEKEGVDYYFVSPAEFERKRQAGELLEWAEVYGNLYGTGADYVKKQLEGGRSVLLELDIQGGKKVKEVFPGAVLIFLVPPSRETAEKRLRGRGTEEEEVIRRRLDNAMRELEFSRNYDYLVRNDELDRCVSDVLAVVRAESMRRERTDLRF